MQKLMKALAAIMLMVAVVCTACTKDPENGNNANNLSYVDLGLPSGLLWATCNIGANTPEEYGDYFAWGETTSKNTYNWNNYKYCNGDRNQLTKYCNDVDYGHNGFTDTLTRLIFSDDAATANWGEEWHIPSGEEYVELLLYTNNVWTTQNGVYGRLFTAPNGASIFLPAAGVREDSDLLEAGNFGDYWTSSLATDYPADALDFVFDLPEGFVDACHRNRGCSIRAVRSAAKN